jgi:uncharacterized protein
MAAPISAASGVVGLGVATPLLILTVALMSGFLSGLSGFGAGLMLSAFLVPIIGAKQAVALLAVAMVVTNIGRMAAFGQRPDLRRAVFVLAGAIPAMIPCAWLLTQLSEALAGLIVAVFLLVSIGLRHFVRRMRLHVGPAGLVSGGAIVGGVSGLSTGGGVAIIPLLLGAGLAGATLIATDAAISLTLQIARSLAFQRFALLDEHLFVFGLIIGFATMPGSWLAARLVLRTHVSVHSLALEVLVVGVALWIGATSLLQLLR